MDKKVKIILYCMLCVFLVVTASIAENSGEKAIPVAVTPQTESGGETRGVRIEARTKVEDLGKYHAVLIGINDYVEMPRLKTPIGDVEALEKILREEYGFEDILLITDKTAIKPTAKNIVTSLRDKAKSLTDQDNLLVYFAGHGEQDRLIDESYWIPIEGKKDDTTSWIPHTSIRSLLETNNIKVKNFLLIADSCYSANLTRGVMTADEVGEKDPHARFNKLKEMASRKSREVITSGSNEPVQDAVKGSSHSLFAHYMLEALKDNEDKYADFASLFNGRIKTGIDRYGLQTPDRSRVRSAVDSNGLFVLAKIHAKDLPPKVDKDALIKQLMTQLSAALGKIDDLTTKNKTTELELEKISKDLQSKNKETSDLKIALNENKTKLDAERSRLESERTVIVKQQSDLALKSKLIAEEESRIKANGLLIATSEIEKLSQEKIKLDAEMKLLKEKERSQQDNFKQLQHSEETYAKRFEMLQEKEKSLAVLDDKYRQREQELKSKDQEVVLLKEQIKSLNQTINDMRGMLTAGTKVPIDPSSSGRFLVLENVVIDTTSKLMWMRKATSTRGMKYDEAEKYVDELTFGDYAQWRLPTTSELEKLIGKEGLDKLYPEGYPFAEVLSNVYYWSSSAVSQRPKVYNAISGNVTSMSKKSENYVWPVRDASPEEIVKAKSLVENAKLNN